MKKLINIFQKINKILLLLEKVICKENLILLDSTADMQKLSLILEKKEYLLNELTNIKKKQMLFEKKYNIYPPYLCNELNNYSSKIIDKCIFLNKINLKNKELIKNKFYVNQKFINLYKSCKDNTIYDMYGNFSH